MANLGRVETYGEETKAVYPYLDINTKQMPSLSELNVGDVVQMVVTVKVKGINESDDKSMSYSFDVMEGDIKGSNDDRLKALASSMDKSASIKIPRNYMAVGDG